MAIITQESKDELYSVLEYIRETLKILTPEEAAPERRADTCLGAAGTHYWIGVILNILEQGELAETHFVHAIPLIRKGLTFNPKAEKVFQYALLRYAFFTGHVEQMYESAKVVSALGIDTALKNDHPRLFFNPNFDVAVSYLWLGEPDKAKAYLEKLPKIECSKNEFYLFEGTTSALNAIVERDEIKLIQSLDQVLDGHVQRVKRFRYALGAMHYVCESAVYITILALKYGMDIKSKLNNTTQILKTKTHSPIDRPDLPKNKKFEIPVDLIPDYMLFPWREYFRC